MTRFLSKKEVCRLIGLSSTQIQRLEHEGRFPKRLRIGVYRNSRVVWIEIEVHDWMKQCIAERDKPHDPPAANDNDGE